MENYHIAFNFLITLNREHKKTSGNKIIYTAQLLKHDSGVAADHDTFDEVIIFLIQKDLIGINKTALPDAIESYFIKNKGSVTLDNFMKSERFKNQAIKTDAYQATLEEQGAVFGADTIAETQGHKLHVQWIALLAEYFAQFETPLERQLVVENVFSIATHDSTVPQLNIRQNNDLCKYCFHLFDSDPHIEESEMISLAKKHLLSIL